MILLLIIPSSTLGYKGSILDEKKCGNHPFVALFFSLQTVLKRDYELCIEEKVCNVRVFDVILRSPK